MRILMCKPDYYKIEYEINPWMNIKVNIDFEIALNQWNNLYQTLLLCGATIDLIKPIPKLPDMVFTANAGLLYKNKIILSHFKYHQRQGEVAYFKNWFSDNGFEFWNSFSGNPSSFEGEGDALLAGDKLFAGYGYRTERRFYEEADYLDKNNIVYCELIDSHFYHIDTCFCPINDKLALWYPPAFNKETQKRVENEIELLPVMEDEAKHFACNAIVLEKNIILPSNCPKISLILEKRGYTIRPCDVSEFLKAGGACKCLILRMD